MTLYVANGYSQNIENHDNFKTGNDSSYIFDSFEMNVLPLPDTTLLINNISFELQNSKFSDSLFVTNPITVKNNISLFTPYSYSFDSFFEGVTIKGFYGQFSFTDFLSANMNLYLSRTYWGNIQSYSYINGSIKAELILKLHNRVQLVGLGQLSVREGLDPNISSMIGGANYYGASLQFKITNKVGFGVGFTNNYYQGNWTRTTYAVPVGY
jgi:hypothetical protein